MASLKLVNINKIYPNGAHAVHDFNLDIKDGEFIVMVGPSGCGKSTTLRMIAGLESISSGDLILDGERVNKLAPVDRDVAMVFQNYALYYNMSVHDNNGISLKIKQKRLLEIMAQRQWSCYLEEMVLIIKMGYQNLIRRFLLKIC